MNSSASLCVFDGGSLWSVNEEPATAPMPRSDQLALERTLLAIERTFLAYFRTSAVFLSSGVAILAMKFFVEIRDLAWVLIGLAPIILGVGIIRTKRSRARVLSSAKN